eukprot:scaffold83045_cov25-Cyclotella_meneghiniana.AAC.2
MLKGAKNKQLCSCIEAYSLYAICLGDRPTLIKQISQIINHSQMNSSGCVRFDRSSHVPEDAGTSGSNWIS